MLDGIDLLIERIRLQQVVMGIEARHDTIIQDKDAVTVSHAEDALGDDDLRHLWQLVVDGLPYLRIRRSVAGRGGVVEYQYLRVFQQGTGNTETLFLSATDIRASLFYLGVITFRHLTDKLVCLCHLTSIATLLQGGIRVTPTQVVKDGAAKQDILL